jgi:hypothetical protein
MQSIQKCNGRMVSYLASLVVPVPLLQGDFKIQNYVRYCGILYVRSYIL